MWLINVLSLFVILNGGQTAKILCLFLSPSPSHAIVGHGILTELAKNGHETTMISFVPLGKSMNNYRDIVMPETQSHKDYQQHMSSSVNNPLNMFLKFPKLIETAYKMNDEVLSSTVFQKILAEENFDLLILGPLMPFLAAYGVHFKCPVIMFSMIGTMNSLNMLFGNPLELSYVPHSMYIMKGVMNFKQRLINIAITVIALTMETFIKSIDRNMYEQNFGHLSHFPSYDEQTKNISLLFINDHFTQSGSRPLLNNIIEIGGIQIKEEPDPLPDDINNWMESNPNGVIYFSLGSNFKSTGLAHDKLEAILKTFSQLKQNILWKFENEQIELPKNVMIKKWLPQDDILAHPNLKLFITHGGLGSIVESKYHTVPLVLIPLFGDQAANAYKVVTEGWGVQLNYADLTESTLTSAVNEVLDNAHYKKTVQSWASLYRDRPQTARQAVVYWTNYVLRHHGAPHMRSNAIELNWLQRNSIDTFGFIFTGLCLVLYLQFKMTKFAVKYLINKLRKNKRKLE